MYQSGVSIIVYVSTDWYIHWVKHPLRLIHTLWVIHPLWLLHALWLIHLVDTYTMIGGSIIVYISIRVDVSLIVYASNHSGSINHSGCITHSVCINHSGCFTQCMHQSGVSIIMYVSIRGINHYGLLHTLWLIQLITLIDTYIMIDTPHWCIHYVWYTWLIYTI
jgi:hypothetical protein